MSLTNKGLVEYVKQVLALGDDTIYLNGAYGNTLVQSFINQKAKQYVYNISRKGIYKKCMDSSGTEYAFDCVGLIKAYLWGGHGKVKYNSKQDKSANGMLSASKVKGKIKTMPETVGLLVQMNGHIGVYIGNGYVIECTPSKSFAKQTHGGGGVCKTKLTDRKWTNWCECPYITYEKETKKSNEEIAKEVLAGKWGNGNARKKALEKAGYDYKAIQDIINGSSKTTTQYYPKCTSSYTSIVSALNSIKVNSSFSNRKKIANKNGIKLYVGSKNQNIKMLDLLKKGKLIKI